MMIYENSNSSIAIKKEYILCCFHFYVSWMEFGGILSLCLNVAQKTLTFALTFEQEEKRHTLLWS